MSQNSYHDGNGVPTLIAVQNDGSTILNVLANPSTHVLAVMNGTSGTDNGPSNSFHDNNHIPIMMATSNVDGVTPVAIYADSSGNLLVDTM